MDVRLFRGWRAKKGRRCTSGNRALAERLSSQVISGHGFARALSYTNLLTCLLIVIGDGGTTSMLP